MKHAEALIEEVSVAAAGSSNVDNQETLSRPSWATVMT